MIKNILVIRFQEMGDTILTTSLLDTLHLSFPNSKIDYIVNDKIAPLFQGHLSINEIISFTYEERHNIMLYVRKVWNIVHDKHYDAIIDLRWTTKSILFSIFSKRTKYRIGVNKWYTRFAYNYSFPKNKGSIIEHNLSLLEPLKQEGQIKTSKELSLFITDEERNKYKEYLKLKNLNEDKHVMLANVTAKLAEKVWNEERMVEVLNTFIKRHPDVQIIFNFAPGQEEENALRIYEKLGKPQQVRVDIKAKSPRELVALCENITLFFGNEGGARHIAHATGTPSLVICAPENNPRTWIPQNSVPAEGITVHDLKEDTVLSTMTREQQYDLITSEMVSKRLETFYNNIKKNEKTHYHII